MCAYCIIYCKYLEIKWQEEEKKLLFCIAQTPYGNDELEYDRIFCSIYKGLTGDQVWYLWIRPMFYIWYGIIFHLVAVSTVRLALGNLWLSRFAFLIEFLRLTSVRELQCIYKFARKWPCNGYTWIWTFGWCLSLMLSSPVFPNAFRLHINLCCDRGHCKFSIFWKPITPSVYGCTVCLEMKFKTFLSPL